MRILVLTQVLPYPPDSGPKIKTYHVLRYLAERHQVVLASFVRGDQSADIAALQASLTQEGLSVAVHTVPMERKPHYEVLALTKSTLTGLPWVITRDERAAMQSLVRGLAQAQPFDAVHADQLYMAPYAALVPGAVRVLDEHNAMWLLYQRMGATTPGLKRWLFRRDAGLLRRYEARVLREFDHVLAVTAEDAAALNAVLPQPRPIQVIPIAVDSRAVDPVDRQAGANHILHIGTMFWPPNVEGVSWFIQDILPLVQAELPEVVFDVVGSKPPQSLRDLAAAAGGVNVTGYVTDPAPYYRKAGVMVVPLQAGGGMRVKILDALALGMPVVTTTIGCEGIPVEHEQHVLIADQPAEFARAVVRLLQDRTLADCLGRNGRAFIEAHYDYRQACRPLDSIYPPG